MQLSNTIYLQIELNKMEVEIRLLDIVQGEHKIHLRFSKDYKGNGINDRPVTPSNPKQISSLELTEHK